MKNTILFLFVAGISFTLMQACYYDNAEELYPDTSTCTDSIAFATDVNSVISTKCATPGCHVAGTGREPFTTHAEIVSAVNGNDLVGRIESGSMPPSGALPTSEIEAIKCWVEQGSQNN